MLRPRSTFLRVGWLLATVIQLVLPPFVAAADAREEATGLTAVSHVEAHGTSACARVHPDDCALCQTLAIGATASPRAALPALSVRLAVARPTPVSRVARLVLRAGDPPQRAPPALS